jgi:retron-type reverse transcriptase
VVRSLLVGRRKNSFVLKTDVESYYASMDHDLVIDRLREYIHDPLILNLVCQYLKRSAERGGLFWEFSRGIPRVVP